MKDGQEKHEAEKRYATLSDREKAVLKAVAKGLTYEEGAKSLGLSVHTFRQHARSVRAKLGVPNRSAAAAWAARHGYE